MPRIVYILPGTRKTYVTTIPNDPGVPAGYLLSNTADGSGQFADGVTDQDMQTQVAGLWSGGYPAYDGTSDQSHTNGHLGGN
jgi:hypothetical protein